MFQGGKMSELKFVAKIFIFSFLVLGLMQIKIGNKKIEHISNHWLTTSSLVHTLNTVAHGAYKAMNDGYQIARNTIHSKLGVNEVESDEAETDSKEVAKENESRKKTRSGILNKVKIVHESQL